MKIVKGAKRADIYLTARKLIEMLEDGEVDFNIDIQRGYVWNDNCLLYTSRQAAYELGKQFMDKLEPDDMDVLSEVLEAHMEVLVAGMKEGYIAGFSDGIRLVIEAVSRK